MMIEIAAAEPVPIPGFTVSGACTGIARWCARHLSQGWAFRPITRRCPITGTVADFLRFYIEDTDDALLFWMHWADEIV